MSNLKFFYQCLLIDEVEQLHELALDVRHHHDLQQVSRHFWFFCTYFLFLCFSFSNRLYAYANAYRRVKQLIHELLVVKWCDNHSASY